MIEPKLVTIDFETYYDKDYSLSKMTTEEYVNDQRFEIIGVGVKVEDGPTEWRSFRTIDEYALFLQHLSDHHVIAHNAMFDGAILEWKLGIHPRFWVDTLSMARPFHNANVGGSLAKLVTHYNLGEKGTEVINALGKRRGDFTDDDLAQYGRYCKNDVDLTWGLYNTLRAKLPQSEMDLIDLTLRLYFRPKLVLDPLCIQKEIELDQAKKEALLTKLSSLDLGDKALSSNIQFAEVLRSLGVEPPTKVSPKTGKTAFAFAKGDADFLALLEHEDELVVAAVEARMGTKSTQKQSRAQRFLGIHKRMNGLIPVPLIYYSAHTGRYGGGESLNLQNLQRASKKDPNSGLLRKAIMAPPGHSVVVVDYSQIEARFLAWLAQQKDKIEAFANRRDVYSEQASVIYGRKVDRKANPDDFTPGFIGKAVVLGCGYGLGFAKFAKMIYTGMLGEKGILFDKVYVDTLGSDPGTFTEKQKLRGKFDQLMADKPTLLDEEQWMAHCSVAQKIINVFRNTNPKIPDLWEKAAVALPHMLNHDPDEPYAFGGPTGDLIRVGNKCLHLPNGMALRYEGLEYDEQTEQFSYLRRKEGKIQRVKIYGGAVVENCVQALARIPTMDMMLKADKIGLDVVLQVHDEIVSIVPDDAAGVALEWMITKMRKPPKWAVGCPLDAEGSTAKRYGLAK